MADVLVVGGGPAGAIAALVLARCGLDVTIVERAGIGRRKVCGEYLSAGAVDRLDRLGLGDVVRAAGSPLRGVRLQTAAAPPVELPFSGTALACTREQLDAALLRAACAAGAQVVQARVDDVMRKDDRVAGVRVRERDGAPRTMPARWTIGADGAGSAVALRAGLTRAVRGRMRFAIGGHYGGFTDLDERVEMYAGAGAYLALNPLGGSAVNALVVAPKRRLASWADDVEAGMANAVAHLSGGRRTLDPAQRVGPRVAVGPLAHAVRSPVAPGLLLAGDAAGFLDPFTGQGLYLAIVSAENAAAAVASAARDRAGETRAFARYARDRGRDATARERLAHVVHLLIDAPPLARRAALRLQRMPALGAALTDVLAGLRPPSGVPLLTTLGRLVL